MKKDIRAFLVTMLFACLLAGCNERKKEQDLNRWAGNYGYSEEPVTASGDFLMLMEWQLRVDAGMDSTRGILEVNGQQTEIKWKTEFSGDSNQVAILFDTAITGPDRDIKRGDTLFMLTKKGNELNTTWVAMEPMLWENPPRECSCFGRVGK